MHTHIHTQVHTCRNTMHAHTQRNTHACAHMHTCIKTHVHTGRNIQDAHTCAHRQEHACTHTYTCMQSNFSGFLKNAVHLVKDTPVILAESIPSISNSSLHCRKSLFSL